MIDLQELKEERFAVIPTLKEEGFAVILTLKEERFAVLSTAYGGALESSSSIR